jgi:surface polysaccharide O-acyltransferase-like enzyme
MERRREEAVRAVAVRHHSLTTILFAEAIQWVSRVLWHLGQTFAATTFTMIGAYINKKKDAATTQIINQGVPQSPVTPTMQNNLYGRPQSSPYSNNGYPYGDNRPPAPPPVSTFPGFN